MSKFIARKERLVEDFIDTISNLDSKSCDEIENNLYEIIKKTRGLIYADQYRQKTRGQTDVHLLNFTTSRTNLDIKNTGTVFGPLQEKIY